MSIMRIWQTQVRADRIGDYERFARERSLPMFRRQGGFEGVVMGREGTDCRVITFWRDEAAVEALSRSESYCNTVTAIEAAGFLAGGQSVRCFAVHLSSLAEKL